MKSRLEQTIGRELLDNIWESIQSLVYKSVPKGINPLREIIDDTILRSVCWSITEHITIQGEI